MLHENKLLPRTVEYLSLGEAGGSHMCSDEAKAKISQSLRGRGFQMKINMSQSLMNCEYQMSTR